MDKVQVLQRAKSYIEMLSRRVNPLSGEVCDDEILKEERIVKCFEYVAGILGEVIENDGYVVKVDKQMPFMLNDGQIESLQVSQEAVSVKNFLKHINGVVEKSVMKNLTPSTVCNWMVHMGYIDRDLKQVLKNQTIYKVNEKSEGVGIGTTEIINKNTGEVTKELLFSREAQQLIINNINDLYVKDVK